MGRIESVIRAADLVMLQKKTIKIKKNENEN